MEVLIRRTLTQQTCIYIAFINQFIRPPSVLLIAIKLHASEAE